MEKDAIVVIINGNGEVDNFASVVNIKSNPTLYDVTFLNRDGTPSGFGARWIFGQKNA